MKNRYSIFLVLIFTGLFAITSNTFAQQSKDLYELKIYHLKNTDQEKQVEYFLENAYLPALERAGIGNIGVFKPIKEDTATTRKIYVFIPYTRPEQFLTVPQTLENDTKYNENGRGYLNAPHDNPPYQRIETVILQAFEGMPRFKETGLTNASSERVYELRSYESATEKLYKNKVKMFNDGEIEIFDRLGFNHIFYGEVIAGSHMPNLMYMTSFSNMESRDKHWDAFGKDAAWKSLSSMEEYQNNMNHADILLLQPTSYSKL